MTAARAQVPSSTDHWLLTIAGAAGIVGLVLPFAYDTSPVDAALDEDLWHLAIPSFLAVPAFAASVRWMVSGSFSMTERVIAYVVSALMACVTLSWLLPGFFGIDEPSLIDWLIVLAPLVILTMGVFVLVRNSRNAASAQFGPVMAIQVAYLANAMLCLVMLYEDLELGAYFVLTAALAYTLQIIVVSMRTESRLQDKLS